MTEEEAKTKWCPFARHANGSSGVGVNRVNWDTKYPYSNCIGSACMAWRWTSQDFGDPHKEIENDGFCGLAGKP